VTRFFSIGELLIGSSTIAVCFIVAYLLFTRDTHSLVYYGDAVSHLVIAKKIFDSINPGIIQLGSLWPPMTHLMLAPFVTNDFLFRTGLAGTIVSAISTAVTTVILFRIVKLQFRSLLAGVISSALYMMNPSVIYMGIIPMMEAPFIMFFILSVYYIQKWYCIYFRGAVDDTDGSNKRHQYFTLIKCALAISAASLTRYEGWLLPFALVITLLIILFFSKGDLWKDRIKMILPITVPLSFAGIAFWMFLNFLNFKDPLFFATYYSAYFQARAFNQDFYTHPLLAFLTLWGVTKAMYGLPVLIISILGATAYIYMNRKTRQRVLFSLLTLAMLLVPLLSDFAPTVHGSILPIKNGGWFNGRYLVTTAPLLAFCSVSLLVYVAKRKKMKLTVATILIVILSYGFTMISQPLEVGKATAMNDGYSLLPFGKRFQFSLETGKVIGSLYNNRGHILLFTTVQNGEEIVLESGIPLKNFIDLASGSYWSISKKSPWVYGNYLIIRKPVDIHGDINNNLIEYWLGNEQILMKHYHLIYENSYYKIFNKKG
jgi:hypothetical protein